jgi:uncharacterized protein YcbX
MAESPSRTKTHVSAAFSFANLFPLLIVNFATVADLDDKDLRTLDLKDDSVISDPEPTESL